MNRTNAVFDRSLANIRCLSLRKQVGWFWRAVYGKHRRGGKETVRNFQTNQRTPSVRGKRSQETVFLQLQITNSRSVTPKAGKFPDLTLVSTVDSLLTLKRGQLPYWRFRETF